MDEWCSIESDPGVFTELIRNYGVKGLQVDEIMDMDILCQSEEPVYGLIFLYKYFRKSEYNPNVLKEWDKDLFFSKQVVQNACATHAILGVLMNKADKINIGPTLSNLKAFTSEMDPNSKGLCISNDETLRKEHNKFAKGGSLFNDKEEAKDGDDVFHFVSYIHFKDSIYEIDGLREGPILIEEKVKEDEWITRVKPHIIDRIKLFGQNEIKFNLLCVIPNRIDKANDEIAALNRKKVYVQNLLEGKPNVGDYADLSEIEKMGKEKWEEIIKDCDNKIETQKQIIKEEEEKIEKYKKDKQKEDKGYVNVVLELIQIMLDNGILDNANA